MKQDKALNVAIVGGGPGCKAIMDMIFAEKLSQLQMNVVGVACTDPKAVGYAYAQEKGIYTTLDHHDLFALKDLDMIIELTGHDEVAQEIARTKADHVRLVDHVAARLFWDIFQIEEQRLSESRQASEALRESEERFQQVADNAEEWIWEIDPNGLYTYTNSIVEKILGYKPAELIGKKHFYDIFYPDDK
ncbi:MAG: PAS domain-containing protein, partial [Deltaproteobacteria bacterium]|nr:PAS domain-containing protein [Deltaproteobacteria bacterium]